MKDRAQLVASAGGAQGASRARVPFACASVASASAASASRSTMTASTRCAAFTVKPSRRRSGGKSGSEAGLCRVDSSAWTEASYSALARRRTRAGSSESGGRTPEVPAPPPAPPAPGAAQPPDVVHAVSAPTQKTTASTSDHPSRRGAREVTRNALGERIPGEAAAQRRRGPVDPVRLVERLEPAVGRVQQVDAGRIGRHVQEESVDERRQGRLLAGRE